ncbi:MAG: hypothetical protein JWM34_4627 [Ilumatobacteraceae bacterium]|nr:hypothetical protein [Ilumatobacteraceae bacterium]
MTTRVAVDRAWVLPDEPTPVRLMNTIWADRTGVHDHLGDVADLTAWLADVHDVVGLSAPPRLTTADVATTRLLRDSFRRVTAEHLGDMRPAAQAEIDIDAALAIVNDALSQQPPVQLARRGGTIVRSDLTARPTIPAIHAALSAALVDLITDPEASQLAACDAPGCVLYFAKDHPRRGWCSVTCGNRARAARHYRRHRLD